MSTMMFYDKIVPLNRERHRKLKIRNIGKADFARVAHFVPMAGIELYQAARDLPVVFAGGEEGSVGLVALLGLKESENLFLNSEGQWDTGTYVPAFIRRYPFILARKDDNFTVCFDESYSGFSEEEGQELFGEDGKETEYLTNVVNFLNSFTVDMERTKAFVERLRELDLLIKRELRVGDAQGRNYFLRDLYIVNEEKLAQLDDATVGELNRQGYLGWIYAHLVSIGNAGRLSAKLRDDDTTDAKAKNDEKDKATVEAIAD